MCITSMLVQFYKTMQTAFRVGPGGNTTITCASVLTETGVTDLVDRTAVKAANELSEKAEAVELSGRDSTLVIGF